MEQYKSNGECSELIAQYKPFLDSYMSLFEYSNLNLHNRSIRTFVGKFIGGSKSEKSKYTESAKYAITKKKNSDFALHMIRRIHAIISKDELYNDLLATLLILAKRYVNNGRNFTAYLMTAFSHEFYRQIKHLHIEVTLAAISYHDPKNDESELPLTFIENQSKLILNLDGDFELSHPDWLSGEIANEPFKSMTKRERIIISKYYEPRAFRRLGVKRKFAPLVSDREIGQLTGRNRKSIQRARKRVVERLEKEWDEGESEWVRARNY